MRSWSGDSEQQHATSDPLAFPGEQGDAAGEAGPLEFPLTGLPESAGQVIDAIQHMSRRIDDLARELNCLGYFDEGDDGPKAA